LKTETAQRILWFAIIFIMLMAAAFAIGAVLIGLAFAYVDVASFITDPTILAFITDYPWAIPYALAGLALVQAIFLFIIFTWRKEPMAHRTGFTIVGVLLLLVGWSLPGFLIILPGLLLEEQ
jgi:ABC-type sulfate transport system permease component